MEKKINKNSLNFPFVKFGNIQPNEEHNSLDKYDIIQFNGMKFPRITLFKPIFIGSFYQQKKDFQDIFNFKESKNRTNKSDIYISLKEKDNKIYDDKINKFSKFENTNDTLNQKEGKKIIFNNFYKNEKINLNKSLCFLNNKGIINDNINFNIKYFQDLKNNEIIQNQTNYINNFIQKSKNNSKKDFLDTFADIKEKQKNKEKSNRKMFNIEQDISSTSSNISNDNIQKNSKSPFVVNEILNNETKKEENTNEIEVKMIANKRGRKRNNNNKKIHTATDDDNIIRKIQVHFISFLTNFINDIIRNFITTRNVPQFSKIDYKLKKTVNHKYFENLKKLKIADILQMRPSPKMKMHDISVNKNIYEKVCKLCPFIQEFLQQDFISIFKEYYNNKSRIYNLNGREITFSDRTKTFIDLINKNYAYKEKIKFIALNYFLEDDKASEKIKFKTNRELIDNNITRE